jgi:hypothetical protein
MEGIVLKMTSRHSLFTEAEMNAMKERLHEDYSDKYSVFANRVRPKLKEIQAWNTPRIRRQVKKLLAYKRKMPDEEEPAQPNDEKTLNEFTQEVGY